MGVVSDTISNDYDHAASRAAAWGLPHVEVFSVWDRPVIELNDDEIERIAAISTEHGVTVSNLATLIMRVPATDAARAEQLQQFDRAVEIAGILGLDRIRCYAFLKEPSLDSVWDRIIDALNALLERARGANITLLLENSSYANVQMATESRAVLDAIVDPRLQLLWDPGNAFALGDPTPTVEAWHLLKDRVAHIHLKDSVAHGSNHWVPLGEGALDLDGLLAAITTDGYRGIVSLETYFDDPDPAVREEKTRISAENLHRAIAACPVDTESA
ncbi:MAG: sugar phosphate isomerase/epimerase [Thermomicrobiales bacterium]|nr:sugar phosphate isomerase/epimerase [Thermomicrobiales bacterium]MCO5220708.1 sugar phosphate isomerase/epimerase [Thermomicrobiales bacterium]